ncbi:MAG: DcaP family trimeric outer membrane transporter [Pseudomonadota bacterium]|nr:DcaP family trimeric outer membrane transporter [Pseudomonadota bacterium]
MIRTFKHRNKKRLLGLALAIALAAPGMALAQTAKEKELEARIAQLEKIVAELSQQQQQTARQASSAQQQVAEVKAVQAATPAAEAKPIQPSTIMTAANPGTRFSYGGFIKLDAMVTDTDDGKIADGGAGRMFYLPASIPVGGEGGSAYTDFGAQFSRFWFSADHTTDAGAKVKAYIEADFFGGSSAGLGNETATNTHGVTLRQAYVSWGDWLAGQTWSNFMDTAALPDAVDFVGVTDGTVFVRQAQIRYTSGAWSFALENPQTTVQPYRTGARYNSGDNVMPDITARWQRKGDWGHFSVAGLLRQYKTTADSAEGASLSVSGKYNVGAHDDIRYAVNYGKGIGRYLAFGIAPDVMTDANGDIKALTSVGGFVAWRHAFNAKLRGNLMYAAAKFDNDTDLTGLGITRSTQSIHANLIYSPIPKLDLGAEVGWGQRELENGQKGDLKRIHTSVKYSF